MSQEIFISYRRKDTGGYAGRLYDYLKQEYGPDSVLFDVEVDATAEQLRSWVQRVIPESSVVLVLIGDQWIEDRHKRQRLTDPDDIVRLEIELALSNEVPIIPLLVDGADVPSTSDLPESIRELVRYKGYELNNSYWEAKFQLLLGAVSSVTRIHTPIVKRGVSVWNSWRSENKSVKPNLTGARLTGMNLDGIDLSGAQLRGADLSGASLRGADLKSADFTGANLHLAILDSVWAAGTKFVHADLTEVDLKNALLNQADLSHANLNGSDLTNASLQGCQVFGVSVWNTLLGGALQRELHLGDAESGDGITVDSIQMAVIIHLLLTSGVRDMIETISSKLVLILGRFTSERHAVLDGIRGELRKRNYVPVLFEFDRPQSRGYTESISLLAHMSRFAIADITDSFQELYNFVPRLPSLPVAPIYDATTSVPVMLHDLIEYPSVLIPQPYKNVEELLISLDEHVIAPAETKIKEMADRKMRIFEQ